MFRTITVAILALMIPSIVSAEVRETWYELLQGEDIVGLQCIRRQNGEGERGLPVAYRQVRRYQMQRGTFTDSFVERKFLSWNSKGTPATFRYSLENQIKTSRSWGKIDGGICELTQFLDAGPKTIRQEIPIGVLFDTEGYLIRSGEFLDANPNFVAQFYYPEYQSILQTAFALVSQEGPEEEVKSEDIVVSLSNSQVPHINEVRVIDSGKKVLSRKLSLPHLPNEFRLIGKSDAANFPGLFQDILLQQTIFPESRDGDRNILLVTSDGTLKIEVDDTDYQTVESMGKGVQKVILKPQSQGKPLEGSEKESDKSPEKNLDATEIVTSGEVPFLSLVRTFKLEATKPEEIAEIAANWVKERTFPEEPTTETYSSRAVYYESRGNPFDRSILLTALLRASSIPARIVLGVRYDAGLLGFVPTAITQAHIGGRWIGLDPSQDDPWILAQGTLLLNTISPKKETYKEFLEDYLSNIESLQIAYLGEALTE